MPRGFGGTENASQALWAAYYLRLLGTYSPGYFSKLTATAQGRAEITRSEIGPATIAAAEQMTKEALGKTAPVFRGVIPQEAWKPYQPTAW
jgi:hypothetical protein